MNHRKYLMLCLVAVTSISVLSITSNGQRKSVAKPVGLSSVKRYVGKVANGKVVSNPAVKKELLALMGARRYKLLDHYTLVQSGVNMVSGDVVASGCAPHECMEKSAIVVVDVSGGKVHAAIFENPILTVYSNEKTFDFLPKGLTDWVKLLVQSQVEDGVQVQMQIASTTSSFEQPSVKTISGFLCNETGGSVAATYWFQTSKGVLSFTFFYGDEPPGIPTKSPVKIGSEFTIRYRVENGEPVGMQFTPTGKVKKVAICEEF